MKKKQKKVPSVLIADDSAFEVDQIKTMFEKMGFEVSWAYTGADAIKQARRSPPDLILLDVVLPDITGHDVCRLLRATPETMNIPLIMITVRDKTEDLVLGFEQGANDYITKPFDARELKARVNACLRMKQLQDDLTWKNEEYKVLLKNVQELAMTDPVTGLFNRRYFREVLQQEFSRAQRYGTLFSCFMIDVDHFKPINDTYGHESGDRVLSEVARLLQVQLRDVDLIARYGGDEFAVLLPESPRAKARPIAERIREAAYSQIHSFLPKRHSVTLSIGISGLPDPGLQHPSQVIATADFALYRAKRGGKNRVDIATFQEIGTKPSPVEEDRVDQPS
ncbi:MAG: diguanylate cyclase [Candidatus Manganitrophus sp.]|nr:diguanylate cyclase [Candidatus Manganitrophus sp.]